MNVRHPRRARLSISLFVNGSLEEGFVEGLGQGVDWADEIIVTWLDRDANIAPWLALERTTKDWP